MAKTNLLHITKFHCIFEQSKDILPYVWDPPIKLPSWRTRKLPKGVYQGGLTMKLLEDREWRRELHIGAFHVL